MKMSLDNFIVVGFSILPTLLTIIGNTVFLVTLAKTRMLHTPSNVLIGALCVTDLLAGVLCQPFYIAFLLSTPGPCCSPVAKALNFTFGLSSQNSFICSLLITLDRYTAIYYPYRYRELATCNKYCFSTFSIFVLTVIYTVIKFKFYDDAKVEFWLIHIGLQLLIITAVLLMYVRIYRVVLSQRNRVPSLRDASFRRKFRFLRREKSRTHTVFIILAVFITCYIPYAVHSVKSILYYMGKIGYNLKFAMWAIYFVLLNSCLNPIIYCARSQEIRRAAVRIFMSSLVYGRNSRNAVDNTEESRRKRTIQDIQCVATSKL